MAAAVLELFPEAKRTLGPPIEDGFYYDFQLPVPLSEKDLPKIEDRMKAIIKNNKAFEKSIISREEAQKLFKKLEQPLKLELIAELPKDDKITIYRTGNFIDLCRGPHLASTGKIGPLKLTSIAGAYWRGSEQNQQLQRIYGTCFNDNSELSEYLEKLEEAEKRDHRKLGKALDLYSVSDDIGPGLILWHPKGSVIRKIIEDFWREEHLKRDYQLVFSPHIARELIWKKSGHLDFYSENMFSSFGIEGDHYLIKPMNCPFHIAIYKTHLHSYKDLPIRYAELGMVYRYEKSGVLHGLTRVRGFTQDDAHIFCTQGQMEDELVKTVKLAQFMLKKFGFKNYKVYLATRPEDFVGKIEIWDKAEKALDSALKKAGVEFQIDDGEGVFYGPKIDIKLEDSLGRLWQGPTIQIDFNEPKKFKVNYTGDDGQEHQAIMIHRTVLGSMERFFGCLVEHYAGAFPWWLAPVQVKVVQITDRNQKYAKKIVEELSRRKLRVELDDRNESVGKKIRDAELEKVPYILVVGDKEEKAESVSVRKRGSKELKSLKIDKFILQVTE